MEAHGYCTCADYSSTLDSRVDGSMKADKDRDILHPNYILDSIEAKKLLPITPKYMYYTSPKTQLDFLKTMDAYGDYYNKKIGTKELLEVHMECSFMKKLLLIIP